MPWPAVELDAVRRLRVLAAALPGTVLAERVVAAPLEQVWSVAADLEGQWPNLITAFHTVRVVSGSGDRLVIMAANRLGQRERFDVVLHPGWCWMQSRIAVGGMAAVEEGDATRVAFVGGLRARPIRQLSAIVQALGEPFAGRVLRRLERCVQHSTAHASAAGEPE